MGGAHMELLHLPSPVRRAGPQVSVPGAMYLFVRFSLRSGGGAVADNAAADLQANSTTVWARQHCLLEATAHRQHRSLCGAGWQHGLPRSAGFRLQQMGPQRNPLPPGRRARQQASPSMPTTARFTFARTSGSPAVHRVYARLSAVFSRNVAASKNELHAWRLLLALTVDSTWAASAWCRNMQVGTVEHI